MNAFFGASEEMFPVFRTVKVLGEKKIGVRTYTPRSETGRLFEEMFSKLARSGQVSDYSAVKIRPEAQSRQSISFELFEKGGWKYYSNRHLAVLDSVVNHAKLNPS